MKLNNKELFYLIDLMDCDNQQIDLTTIEGLKKEEWQKLKTKLHCGVEE